MINLIITNTTKCQIEDIKLRLSKNDSFDNSDIVIAEDRFTLSLEQEILSAKVNNGSFSTNVYSFARLLYQILKNEPPKRYMTKTGGIMLISKVLAELSDELLCYKQVAKSYSSLSKSIYDVLAQIKSSQVDPMTLGNAQPNSKALSAKTADLSAIYKRYEELKENILLDAADKIDVLEESIKTSQLIKNSSIHIIGFTSFTKQFYGVITELFKYAKDVNLYVLGGNNDVYNSVVKERAIEILETLSLPYKVIEKREPLDGTRNSIANYLFSYTPSSKIIKTDVDNVFMYQGNNLENELKFVAEKILYEVRIEGKKFSDIAIIGSNLSENHNVIAKEMRKYNIPIFLDDKVTLDSHILSKVIISMLNIAVDGYSIDNVMTIITSPFFDVDFDEKCQFENHLVAKGINKRNFHQQKLFKDETTLAIQQKFIEEFKVEMPSISSVENYSNSIRAIVEKFTPALEQVAESFVNVSEFEHSAITKQASAKFLETLQELDDILGELIIPLEEYIQILKDGLSAKEVSIAPLYSDCVFIGDFSSSKFTQKKVLFAISVNNKLVPMEKSDIGLLTDRDIDGLLPTGINLEPKIEMINDQERLNVYLALLNFKEKLYITYSTHAMNFDVITPSEIVTSLQSFFTYKGAELSPIDYVDVDYNNDTSLSNYLFERTLTPKLALYRLAESVSKIKTGDKEENIIASTVYKALKDIDEEKMAKIIATPVVHSPVPTAFCDRFMYSVSNLESYFSCPYKNFVQNAIYARDRDEGIIKAIDSGNYLHKALEYFMEQIPSLNRANYVPVAKNCLEKVREQDIFKRLDELPRFSYAMDRLDIEFMGVAEELIRRTEVSQFTPLGQEIKFGYNAVIPPIELKNGAKLRGSVDYADSFQDKIRVIDYKTGSVIKADFKSIFLGQKFQPYIYLQALGKHYGKEPCGALYFPIQPKFIGEDENLYKMSGHITNDVDTVIAMDNNISANGKSDIVSARLTKVGKLWSDNNILNKEEFQAVIDYSMEISDKAINEIRSGNIAPSPYKDSCEHCQYLPICGYDKKYYGERQYKGNISKDTIIDAIKMQENPGTEE